MNILVLYYTQTGQLKEILDHVVAPLQNAHQIYFAPIEIDQPYPFPWKTFDAFFDAMPESVLGIPFKVIDFKEVDKIEYDLIILGLQPWFLSPSVPISSFLQSSYARILSNKPVITVIGSRNMWLRCIEIVKQHFIKWQANYVGHIVLEDNRPNLTSTITIGKWLLTGNKGPYKRYPEAGIIKEDIKKTTVFGDRILSWINDGMPFNGSLQQSLIAAGAVTVKPSLIILEGNGAKLFPKWANRAIQHGPRGAQERQKVLKVFKVALYISIFILSPISSLIAAAKARIQHKKIKSKIKYFQNTDYIPNQI